MSDFGCLRLLADEVPTSKLADEVPTSMLLVLCDRQIQAMQPRIVNMDTKVIHLHELLAGLPAVTFKQLPVHQQRRRPPLCPRPELAS